MYVVLPALMCRTIGCLCRSDSDCETGLRCKTEPVDVYCIREPCPPVEVRRCKPDDALVVNGEKPERPSDKEGAWKGHLPYIAVGLAVLLAAAAILRR